ncbi:hypothetical protein LSAT2_005931 [Lamellibrachia satsuma]|nr:hypothetical protein LSAT2_005931 [Lamellibrachia satsuma]
MPSGAPKSACVSMTPDHVDTSAEMSTPPYSLQLERGVTTYTPGQTLKGIMFATFALCALLAAAAHLLE